ncbi:hypothetical protein SDC9_185033 [bioreactor metagenome]|uniref:Uncharacterized protein n=1 Tax=bioreactor metagenome TaxID=1076179 RepID=A0A645HN33_9ZZZZ
MEQCIEGSGGEGNPHCVVEEGPEQVLPDEPHGGAAQLDRGGDRVQPVPHQHHVGRLHGDVGSRPDRDADVCLGQRRSVVDAVADHGDDPARRSALKLPDDSRFVAGQQFGAETCQVEIFRHRFCRRKVVAGQHDRVEAERVEPFDRFGRTRFQPVADADHSGRDAVCRRVNQR